AGREQDDKEYNEPESGDVETEQRTRSEVFRKDEQDLIERRQQEVQDPDRDAERHPHQQPGDQITSHRCARQSKSRAFQWQPQFVPQEGDAAASLFVSDLLSDAPAPSLLASVGFSALPLTSFFAAGLLLFLKSVAYQPEPLSWKPAADTSFVSVSFSQDGQMADRKSVV